MVRTGIFKSLGEDDDFDDADDCADGETINLDSLDPLSGRQATGSGSGSGSGGGGGGGGAGGVARMSLRHGRSGVLNLGFRDVPGQAIDGGAARGHGGRLREKSCRLLRLMLAQFFRHTTYFAYKRFPEVRYLIWIERWVGVESIFLFICRYSQIVHIG